MEFAALGRGLRPAPRASFRGFSVAGGRPITAASSLEDWPLRYADALIHYLPDPIAVVAKNGDTVESNRALLDLALRCGTEPKLIELFGAPFARLLARAWIERHLTAHMPLATGPEPRTMFLVSFVSTSDDKTLGVIIHDVSSQLDGFRQLADRDQDFTVLRDIGMALSGTIEPDQITERIYEETFRIIPSRNIYIAFYDRASDTVSFPRYVEDGEWHELKSRPFGNGITEYVMRSGQPLLLAHDVEAQAHELGIEPIGRPCMSWIGAPMAADGEVIGVIALQDYEVEDAFNEHHLEILSVVATQAAAAITNVYLLEAERRTYRELAEAQSRLLESERLRGVTETVGALNHEINNPLAAIAGNAQLLLKSKGELKKDSTQKVEAILEATRRIQRVTGKMATLIQATTIPYPGKQEIIDVENSISSQDAAVPVSADVDEALDTEV